MIDDMQGLYTHTSDALRDGRRQGRQDFFDAVLNELRKISVEQEGEQGALADRGFHVAQECCGAVVRLKALLDAERKIL